MNLIANLSHEINRRIAQLDYPESPGGLYEPIKYMLSGGGKRLRPTLLAGAALAGGATLDNVMNQAVAIEMFHNFTLLHDDVMDNADVRHGRPTVHVRWNVPTAILSGDMMLSLAYRLMAEGAGMYGVSIMHQFDQVAEEVYQGQQYDMDFENRDDITEDEYINMIRLKTSVLLAAACRIGATLGGFDDESCSRFYDYGINMGLAFQLRDDYLDSFGDPKVFGKAIGGDIVNGKNTWLRIMARKLGGNRLSEIEENHKTSDELVAAVKELYVQLGLDEQCMKLVRRYTEQAVNQLVSIPMDEEYRNAFIQMAESAVTREK